MGVSSPPIHHRRRRAKHLGLRNVLCAALLVSAPVAAQEADSTAAQLRALDVKLQPKGWDIPYPSFSDTLTGDLSGYRTTLAQYGFGLITVAPSVFAGNVLNTPRTLPAQYNFFGTIAPCVSKFSPCAGNQVYFGQQASGVGIWAPTLTYDLSRLGVPDGQIVFALAILASSWEGYLPNAVELGNLTWWQTAFDKRMEIEVGYMSNAYRYMGTQIGGNFANTFGPGASINILLGESYLATPGANFTFHLNETLYDKFGVQVSGVVRGKTGNPVFDEHYENPTAFAFASKNTGTFFINEVGYKTRPQPGSPFTWIRGGLMYNTADFTDLRSSDPNATIKGNEGVFFLTDRQLWQQDPTSSHGAGRGIYAGFTYMGAPAKQTPITDYYEGRAYWVGPFDSRPHDMLSFVYFHQDYSKYLTASLNALNVASMGTAPGGFDFANSYSISYLGHLAPGLYAQIGLSYTDHPAGVSYKNEGSALLIQGSITTVF
jgi:porin